MDDPSLLGSVILIIILTVVNAFLAGAEMAFVSLNPTKIKELAEKGDKKAIRVEQLLEHADEFLSAIQVVITFAGFFNSASASQAFVGRLIPFLSRVPGGQTLATIIVTLILSYVTLVLGELYPKQLALQIPEQYARLSAGIILAIKNIFRPFVWLLTVSTGVLKRLTPINFHQKEEKLTRAEIRALLRNGRNDGVIDSAEFTMMKGVLALDSKRVREIMVPRVDAFMIDLEDDIMENVRKIIEQSYSRIPIYRGDKDHIVGILTLKDLIINLEKITRHEMMLEDLVREALFVHESTYIDNLLYKFKKSKQLLAVVTDEYGGVSGIVTLEDLVEEIVGEISDEDDEPAIKKVDEQTFIVQASLSLDEFNTYFETSLVGNGYETIAGYVLDQLGYIPKQESNERVHLDEIDLIVDSVNGSRIQTIKVLKY